MPSKRPALQLPHSKAQRWILAHDIRDPKRLQRLWRYLRQEALPLQYSVYLLRGSSEQVSEILERVQDIIDAKADDVRIYPIGENTRIWTLGTQSSDDGNTLVDSLCVKMTQRPTENAT